VEYVPRYFPPPMRLSSPLNDLENTPPLVQDMVVAISSFLAPGLMLPATFPFLTCPFWKTFLFRGSVAPRSVTGPCTWR